LMHHAARHGFASAAPLWGSAIRALTQGERWEETAALLPLMAAQGVQADQWMVDDLAFVGLHPDGAGRGDVAPES